MWNKVPCLWHKKLLHGYYNVNQASLTLSLTSVGESAFFGLEGTVLNLGTNTLKHGRKSMYSAAKIKGAATSHPNNCKNWYKLDMKGS